MRNQKLPTGMEEFFFADFYKDDIRTDFFDTFKRDDIFGVTSEEAADFPGTGDNDRLQRTVTEVNDDICHTSKTFTVTNVDYFFFA